MPLQAQWLVDTYDYFTSVKGNAKGWKKAELCGLIDTELPLKDPFKIIFLNKLSYAVTFLFIIHTILTPI